MPESRKSNPVVYALYVNAAVLCAILVVILFKDSSPPMALGQFQPSIGGGGGVFVMPAQFSKDIYGCYLLDVDAQTLAVYRFDPLKEQLRLAAARNFRFDRKLGNFNTAVPSPLEVKEMLEKELHGMHAATQETVSPVVQQPAVRP
jgi:hypothetical protein